MKRGSPLAVFLESASRFAGNPAIAWRDQTVSYQELDEQSTRIASYLISQGACTGDLIVVMLGNSFDVIPALLGIWKAGCVFVPIDPGTPRLKMATMIATVNPQWVITEARKTLPAEDGARSLLPAGRILEFETVKSFAHAVDEDIVAQRRTALGPDDMCYLYFTSGSTGVPKAIAGRLKSVDHFGAWEAAAFDLPPGCRVSQLTNAAFDAILRDIFLPLYLGGTICIPDSRESILDAKQLAQWIDQQRIQLVHCVPSLFRMLLTRDLRSSCFPELRYVLLAGEALPTADVKKWMGVFDDRIQLVNLYGPTETTMVKFFHRVSRADLQRKIVPIGRPIDGARAVIMSPEGKACLPNFAGEIYIRTPYSSLGYYKQPELTRQVFVPNPFSGDPDDLVYRTGDLGRMLTDGTFEYLGRMDFQLKLSGMRVEPAEIEAALRSYDGIRDAVVVAALDAREETYLVGYVAADASVSLSGLREHLAGYVPVPLIPSTIIRLDALPLTLNGKLDRNALPPPERQRPKKTGFHAPNTETEKKLASVWAQLLGLEPIGIDDDFFELGGHSLLATRLMAEIRGAFGVDVPLAALFENPKLGKLASAVEEYQILDMDEAFLEDVVEQIDHLSEEQAKAALSSAADGVA